MRMPKARTVILIDFALGIAILALYTVVITAVVLAIIYPPTC